MLKNNEELRNLAMQIVNTLAFCGTSMLVICEESAYLKEHLSDYIEVQKSANWL